MLEQLFKEMSSGLPAGAPPPDGYASLNLTKEKVCDCVVIIITDL